MIGKRYWIVIWWGILALGVVGLVGAGREQPEHVHPSSSTKCLSFNYC